MDSNDPELRFVRKLELVRTSSAAVTFHFRREDKESGWALCTVNDETGELVVQSDWGNWTFRWNVQHLGPEPTFGEKKATLTQFIADRSPESCDYLADKLTTHEERHVFDAEKTVAAMRRDLCRARLEEGRRWIEYYEGEDEKIDLGGEAPRLGATYKKVWIYGVEEEWPLENATARSLFDALGEILTHDDPHRDSTAFCNAFSKIEGHAWITEEPWDYFRHTPSSAYQQLLHGILPALVEACFARAYPGRHRCKNPMPREAGAGHWRDWHRGHQCQLDDTPIDASIPPAAKAATNHQPAGES